MHKYFAKPLFLGKKVEFLPECHSTNEQMLLRVRKADEPEGYVVHSDHQTRGKGQRGNAWISESGKNLLFSMLLRPKTLSIKHSYYLNLVAGLAVVSTLEDEFEMKAELKWPNDVYVNDKKIAGILVETSLIGHLVEYAVVGIGLNVNQKHFSLPFATSICMEKEVEVEREMLLEKIIAKLESYYLLLKASSYEKIIREYYDVMRWRGEVHQFADENGEFSGEIIGIDDIGRLLVKTFNELRRFEVKQITFLQ
ncbi:MAG: biotin--[acetyl-CoA-carboxylase] ligase [Marinoscillum sp.]